MLSAVANSAEMIIGGRYRVIRALASGGMGTVYEAENTRTRRKVAIKTIRPEVAQRVSVVERFEREAQAAGQLRHPNIIDVLDLGDDPANQLLFIVEEFLEGVDLGAYLRTVGTIEPRAALATLLPIMDALTFAHARAIVHRDLKPDNIFLHETPQGVIPKLIDFGIAKLAGAALDSRRSGTGSLVGSPIYMSPEQARADASVDARTDVWSMGVVFYEALTGRTPFEGANAFALFTKIASDEPLPLARLGPALPPDLVAVVQRAVTKDRDARWPTMAAFAAALRGCEAWRGVEPGAAARWIVNAGGLPPDDHGARELADKATLDMGVPGPVISTESGGDGSGLWTSELSPEPPLAAAPRGHWTRITGAAVLVAVVVAVVVESGRDHGAASALLASRPPPVAVAATRAPPTQLPVAPEPVAPEPVAPVVAPAAVADAGAPRVTLVRRAPPRVVRHPAPPPATELIIAPPLARGFNGAPIVD